MPRQIADKSGKMRNPRASRFQVEMCRMVMKNKSCRRRIRLRSLTGLVHRGEVRWLRKAAESGPSATGSQEILKCTTPPRAESLALWPDRSMPVGLSPIAPSPAQNLGLPLRFVDKHQATRGELFTRNQTSWVSGSTVSLASRFWPFLLRSCGKVLASAR